MKKSICINTILIAAFLLILGAAAFGQVTPTTETPAPNVKKPQDMRTTVLAQLGLSREQIQLIRRVNIERKPLMNDAQKRFRDANRLLNEAIYADQINEADVHARLKEVQLAQAEVARIRFMNEFAVRRILTPEQLVLFRDLRSKFEQMRMNLDKNRSFNGQNRGNAAPVRDGKRQFRPVLRPNQPRP